MNRVLAAATLAALAIGINVQAQGFGAADDGIAASPKVRAQLDERRANQTATVPAVAAVTVTKPVAPVAIAASPKLAQMLAERQAMAPAGVVTVASTTAPAEDGIAASPKLRQQLNERSERIEIAPVK